MTDLHLPTFFAYARRAPFGGRLTQAQVQGCEAIIAAARDITDDRHLAYILATAFHETGGRMVPVREGFAKTDAGARRAVAGRRYAVEKNGHVYYGRGLPQLTWERNYIRMGLVLGVDMKNNPDLMLDPDLSARALVLGMLDGMFTTKRLSDYFGPNVDDPEGARRIVNGTDKASLIAGYYVAFLDSIKAARAEQARPFPAPAAVAEAAKPDGADLKTDKTAVGGVLAGLGGIAGVGALVQPILQGIASPWAFAAFALVAVGVFLVLTGRVQIKRVGGV